MEVKLDKLPNARVKLEIFVPAQENVPYFEKALAKLSDEVEIKGFRKGQAPRLLVIEKAGQNRYLQEVLDLILPATYQKALEDNNLRPIATPAIKLEALGDGADLRYSVEVDSWPEIKLKDYTKLKIKEKSPEKKSLQPTEKELNSVLENLRLRQASFKEVERGANLKDRVEINFTGMVDGVVRENLTNKNYPVILGSGALLPDFEKQLIDMKKGENKKFTIDIPKPNDPKARGERAQFTVNMLSVCEVILPPKDDKLAVAYGHKKYGELERAVAESIEGEKRLRWQRTLEAKVIEKALPLIECEIPQSLVQRESARVIEQMQKNMRLEGPAFEQYLSSLKKTRQDLEKDLLPSAVKNVKIGFLLGEVVKREKIDPKSQDSAQRAINRLIEITTGIKVIE